jgi:predicted membrane protein
MLKDLFRAILGGAVASLLFEVLTFTHFRNIGVKALGPAINLVEKWDPNCFAKPYCDLKSLIVNLFMWSLTILVLLGARRLLSRPD